jgi:hypothetical protein
MIERAIPRTGRADPRQNTHVLKPHHDQTRQSLRLPGVRSFPETFQSAPNMTWCVRWTATGPSLASGPLTIHRPKVFNIARACVSVRQLWLDAGLACPVTFTVLRLVRTQTELECAYLFVNDLTHHLSVRSSRKLRLITVFSEKQLLHFTNFSTLTQCANHQVYHLVHVLAFFHKHFQGC